jgi:hypothetical protein
MAIKKKKNTRTFFTNEAKGFALIAAALFGLFAMVSFTPSIPEANWFGIVGYHLATALLYSVGIGGYIISFIVGWQGVALFRGQARLPLHQIILFMISFCLLANVIAEHGNFSFLENHLVCTSIITSKKEYSVSLRTPLGGMPLYLFTKIYLTSHCKNYSVTQASLF